jgi:hypothetical protein
MSRATAFSIVLAALILPPTSGCGGSSSATPVATLPVKGKVMYKGQPLIRGTVAFEPEGKGAEAHGDIQPDGTFSLSTYKAGDGAVPGAHRVSVSGSTAKGKDNVPAKYKSFGSSKLETEVSAAQTDYTFDLK